MIVAPRSSSDRLVFKAAGFIATRTLGESPGVRMSREAKWIWNADTPASVPAGARVSAGKFGSVARSLPSTAVASVKRLPASCIPSPESPANRTTTRSRSWIVLLMPSGLSCASPAYEVYAGAQWTRGIRAERAWRALLACLLLQLDYVDGLRALGTLLLVEGHPAALRERPVAVGIDARVVNEQVA